MNIKSKIHEVFPTPVYVSNIDRPYDEGEISLITETEKNTYLNTGNKTSNDLYILNNPLLLKLKNNLLDIVQDYFDKIISTSDDVKPFITQSWLNYTKQNGYHHSHTHTNSLVSGVLYIDCIENLDKITFLNTKHQNLEFTVKDYNAFNSTSRWFLIKKGMVILFPSYLEHHVELKEHANTRISLAFNVFIKGKIGNYKFANELTIN